MLAQNTDTTGFRKKYLFYKILDYVKNVELRQCSAQSFILSKYTEHLV